MNMWTYLNYKMCSLLVYAGMKVSSIEEKYETEPNYRQSMQLVDFVLSMKLKFWRFDRV